MDARIPSGNHQLMALLFGIVDVPAHGDCEVLDVAEDSRLCAQGSLFLAQAGESVHGLTFLSQVIDAGAVAIVGEVSDEWSHDQVNALSEMSSISIYPVENLSREVSLIASRFYNDPSKQLRMVGVTGTNGKTSCAHFVAQAMSRFYKSGVIGTIGMGFPEALSPSSHTTPSPVLLQSKLHELLDAGAKTVAMEVSSHGMSQGRVAAVDFDVAVLTNLTRDHLDYHGTMEAYADSKRALFLLPNLSTAVLNLDDVFGQALLNEIDKSVQIYGYSTSPNGARLAQHWVEAVDIQSSHQGLSIEIESSLGNGHLTSPLLGRFNVSNLLAVLGTLLAEGICLGEAIDALESLSTVPGRMERFGRSGDPLVVVDYAHTPDALEQALLSLQQHTVGRLICVFGCGGDRDKGKRPQMASIAERYSDVAIVTDDNPRTESGDAIVDGIVAGFTRPDQIHVQRDRGAAIAQAIKIAQPSDTVLIAGKGHEDYQLVGNQTLHFSDRECVAECLSGSVS